MFTAACTVDEVRPLLKLIVRGVDALHQTIAMLEESPIGGGGIRVRSSTLLSRDSLVRTEALVVLGVVAATKDIESGEGARLLLGKPGCAPFFDAPGILPRNTRSACSG